MDFNIDNEIHTDVLVASNNRKIKTTYRLKLSLNLLLFMLTLSNKVKI